MRFLASIGAFVFYLFLRTLSAQEPALPKSEPEHSAAAVSPAAKILASPPPELIPSDVLSPSERAANPAPSPPNVLGLPQLDESFKQNPLSTSAENTRKHEDWRQLQNRVANDGEVKAALRTADAAHTDLEKRRLLRTYYEIYFGKMIALASSAEMKTYLVARKNDQLNALPQPRVRPSPTPAKTR